MFKTIEAIGSGIVGTVAFFDRKLMTRQVRVYRWQIHDGEYWPETGVLGRVLSNLSGAKPAATIEFRRMRLLANTWRMNSAIDSQGNPLPIIEDRTYSFQGGQVNAKTG